MRLVNYNPYEIQMMKMKGFSTKQIAYYYNTTANALTIWCSRHNVCLLRLTDFEIKEEIKIKTVKEISFEYQLSERTIYTRLKKMGISPKVQLRR